MNRDFNDVINKLKEEVIKYQYIKRQYNDVMYLWKDVTKYIEELENKYRVNSSFELKKELEQYRLQERDYKDLFNEYQIELSNFNSDIVEKVKFYNLYCTFNDLCNKIHEIEDKSKKFGSKKIIGTNRVETLSAEGRKKYIHENLLSEYNELVFKKKEILPIYKKLYDKFINGEVIDSKSCSNVINDIEMTDDEKLKLEQSFFDGMTIDKKIKFYNERINRIMSSKNTGRKVRVKVYGNYYKVPKKYKNTVIEYLTQIRKLNDLKSAKKVVSDDYILLSSSLNDNDKKIEEKKKSNVIALPSKVSQLIVPDTDENIVEINSFIEEKKNSNVIALPSTVSDGKKDFTVNLGSDFKVVDTADLQMPSVQFTSTKDDSRDIWSDSKKEQQYYNSKKSKDEEKTEDKGKLKVIATKKPKSKWSLKKKIVAAALVCAAALTTAFGIFGFGKAQKKDEGKKIISGNDTSYNFDDFAPVIPTADLHNTLLQNTTKKDDVTSHVNEQEKSDNVLSSIGKQKKVENEENSKNGNNIIDNVQYSYTIGESVTIIDYGSVRIYKDVYSAMNEENGYNPYFEYEKEREVKGYFISTDGSYVYSENQSVVNELLNNNGVIESVVVGDQYGYEGAYNPRNVKYKVRN